MNQDILFADLQTWTPERQAVMFPAQQAGALIQCWVSLARLQQSAAQPLSSEAEILAAFAAQRFDLEEIAETLIEDEDFDVNGDIQID
ncbi:transcriptional regulator [Photobacterium jeanii]|uniref:Transcriptional regulator n=1 Tax=Photobacterium jeanii TaxID=858640 RepID=A0A178K6M0_9GAMM|nr:DUF1488 domain-containing protein [Photobacterium jeanii]OAN12615.1 transcriptional regulator [Photobacterium jeanii]PST86604.1 DUF1488 domain-containing protein [Photobacterium jeanii]